MRLFIALALPEPLKADLVMLQSRLPGGRPVPEDNMHLTLAFLDDQPADVVDDLCDALESLRAAPIDLTLSGVDVFGGRHQKAIAMRADGGACLRDLHDRLRNRLHGAGIMAERRRFRPHVTLARLRGSANPAPYVSALGGISLGPVQCLSFGVFQSHLRPEGAVYEELALFPLG